MRSRTGIRPERGLFRFQELTPLFEFKSVPAEYKADSSKRTITGYASVFGNVDLVGDVVLPGAYTKTLAEDLPAGRIKVKRNHRALIGLPVHAEQDQKGLLTVSRISKTALGDETLALVEDGVIDRMSIGYRPELKSYSMVDGQKVRQLEVLRLNEWTFADDPAVNPEAIVLGVKSLADVSYAIYQMQDALRALQTLNSTPPEIVQRLTAMITDMQAITAGADDGADQYAPLGDLVASLRKLNNPPMNNP